MIDLSKTSNALGFGKLGSPVLKGVSSGCFTFGNFSSCTDSGVQQSASFLLLHTLFLNPTLKK